MRLANKVIHGDGSFQKPLSETIDCAQDKSLVDKAKETVESAKEAVRWGR